MNDTPFIHGANPSTTDSRDILHTHLVDMASVPQVTKASIDYSADEVLDQGQKGVCTAISLAAMMSKMFGFKVSWAFLYKQGKKLDGNTDEGSSLRTMLQAAQKFGVPRYELAPYNPTNTYAEFMAESDYAPEVYADALLHKLPAYAQVLPLNEDTMIQALATSKYGLYTRIVVGSEFWTAPDGTRTYDPALLEPIRTPQNIIGGHAIITRELDYTVPQWTGEWRNSWGIGYCDKGDSQFPTSPWVKGQYLTEAWVISDKYKHTFNSFLCYGMSGDEVIALQTALKLDGEFNYETTGFFGSITLKAVRDFQRKYGITPLGIVGPATRKALNLLY